MTYRLWRHGLFLLIIALECGDNVLFSVDSYCFLVHSVAVRSKGLLVCAAVFYLDGGDGAGRQPILRRVDSFGAAVQSHWTAHWSGIMNSACRFVVVHRVTGLTRTILSSASVLFSLYIITHCRTCCWLMLQANLCSTYYLLMHVKLALEYMAIQITCVTHGHRFNGHFLG